MDKHEEEEWERRVALIREQVTGLRLTAAKKQLLADIEKQALDYSEDFLKSLGSIMSQSYDPGSSWELVEAEDGTSKLVRHETPIEGPVLQNKHAYSKGQSLCIWSTVLPDDVIIRECLGEKRYRVQSEISSREFEVEEKDLYDPNMEQGLFDGEYPVGVGEVAQF